MRKTINIILHIETHRCKLVKKKVKKKLLKNKLFTTKKLHVGGVEKKKKKNMSDFFISYVIISHFF